jgi:hypothetical protein
MAILTWISFIEIYGFRKLIAACFQINKNIVSRKTVKLMNFKTGGTLGIMPMVYA